MNRRLYYMLPDIPSARAILDELLLKRISESHLHFIARDGTLPQDMPDGNPFHKTDLIHAMQMGMMVGGLVGLITGGLITAFPPEGLDLGAMTVLACGLGGALFGTWASGMNGAANPNSRLAPFMERIAQGQVLLIVDLPARRVAEIEELLESRHPEIKFGGQDAHVPAFP
ncbi:DUF1269 domain-containing protein [Zemynaea arenosa]|nr:DUF1269 domain-containing protein [Massilia arenosa]